MLFFFCVPAAQIRGEILFTSVRHPSEIMCALKNLKIEAQFCTVDQHSARQITAQLLFMIKLARQQPDNQWNSNKLYSQTTLNTSPY